MSNDQIIAALTLTLQQINKLTIQAQTFLKELQTVTPIPSPQPVNPQPNQPQTCFMFDIHCEKPESSSSKYGVILSAKDFNILKQNDHFFTVIPANPNQFTGVPNMTIHDLTVWIAAESVTPVPDVPADDA